MRKLNLAIALTIVALLALGSVAIARKGISPKGVFSYIEITKTYDIYGVECTSGPCQEEGKCLGTMDAGTVLTICGLQFDIANTEYKIYEWCDEDEDADWVVENCPEITQGCLDQDTDYGRVRYHLLIHAKNPGRTPSKLVNATLCLGAISVDGSATDDPCIATHVGSDYEQVADVYGGEALTEVILPEPTNKDVGQNVILCPITCED
jgi:hypothetical protein